MCKRGNAAVMFLVSRGLSSDRIHRRFSAELTKTALPRVKVFSFKDFRVFRGSFLLMRLVLLPLMHIMALLRPMISPTGVWGLKSPEDCNT
jgi:hypothetical protein